MALDDGYSIVNEICYQNWSSNISLVLRRDSPPDYYYTSIFN